MGENNRSSGSAVEDIDNKLKQYMLINKQISRTLTMQRMEISNLKNSLRMSEAEGMNLRIECHKWKKQCESMTKLYIAQVESITGTLQSNTNSFNRLSRGSLADSCNALVDQIESSPKTQAPRNVDSSRRVSKSFESTKNRSQRRNDQSKYCTCLTLRKRPNSE